jgi:acyl transferase domain-containing protein/NAD(P)-dependent dehydrogenase (short-subunit alcohol dehydrogenase family)
MRSMPPTTWSNPGVTFTFPGQGSYSHAVLRELYDSYPQTIPYFHQTNNVARELLNADFLTLVNSATTQEHDQRLSRCPDLDQFGIYLTEVLIARLLIESGIAPALLVGHSFGELAALATGGVYSIETGLRIVGQRVLALQSMADPGAMAAITCGIERARQCIEELGNSSIEISVINHPRQTVLSGTLSELEGLRTVVNRQGISLTLLKSRYPYHSSFLQRAVEPFFTALQEHDFSPAKIPVYLCMEGMLYSPGSSLPQVLSSQFVRPLKFGDVVKTLYESGYRTFIECGAGNIVTRLMGQNLARSSELQALSVTPLEGSLREGLLYLGALGFGESAPNIAASETVEASRTSARTAQLLASMSLVVKDMSQMIKDTSSLIEQVADSLGPTATAAPYLRENALAAGRMNATDVVLPAGAALLPNHSAEELISPPDARPIETAAVGPGGNNGFAVRSLRVDHQQVTLAEEECKELPIAIVSMGCVLPGASDPEQYWSNILNGVSGISNLADTDPSAAHDFLARNGGGPIKITPDKTYTLLHGSIVAVPYDSVLLSPTYNKEQFELLTNGQKLLALALAQSLSRLNVRVPRTSKVQCILGATADGSKEYDDALFIESVQKLLGDLDEPESLRRAFADTLKETSAHKEIDSNEIAQHKIYAAVVEKLLGRRVPTYVVDTACSSSLYSTYLGIKGLQDGECDIVLAGGVFAPGPANNTLFAQFKGLAQRESRPFDASADGVVFGDGAGVVILKRLPDALQDGDRVLAVIRGVGLSSDGRSPSINVPQAKGQGMAIRNAYDGSCIDVDTVQYVEAHATATLVGDAVEFNALKEVMKRAPDSPRIELGSVKALIGHTGWAAGVASLIKICKAFAARVIPRQYNYVSPSLEIDLAQSQFTIPEVSHPWPDNLKPFPRRAAINGFGFGGTNAHLILEEFDDSYHGKLCDHLKLETRVPASLAVISVGGLFPNVDGSIGAGPSSELRFRRESLHLPAGKMLLPDVTDHMDASQYLASLAAEKVFSTMPEGWVKFKNAMGVVLGLESKTQRGMRANERIFVDRLQRQVLEQSQHDGLSGADLNRILDKLIKCIRERNVPSGPYTLPGLMPNVTASRIANMFDLNGPNIVIDMGPHSLQQSLFVARQLLAHGDCKIVLAGGINANSSRDREGEAVCLLALTTIETAQSEGLSMLGSISLLEPDEKHHLGDEEVTEVSPTIGYKGAHGAPEILRGIQRARETGLRCVFKQSGSGPVAGRGLVFDPTSAPRKAPSAQIGPGTHAYVQGTPIRSYTPQLISAKANGQPRTLQGQRILFLTDQPGTWLQLENSGALEAFDYKVICPRGAQLANSLSVDLTSEEGVQHSLAELINFEFDLLIGLKALDGHAAATLLEANLDNELVWLDLLFAVCRHSYERIPAKGIPIITVCQSAYRNSELDPYTGLVSGFMKSLSRELGGPLCRAINTDEISLFKTLRQVEIELGQPGSEVEVCYQEGERSTFTLAPVDKLSQEDRPYLDSDSVVIATGGARGVTSVLVEELLERFGCRVIALGRTDPASVREEVREMDEQSFKNYEPEFYKNELARNKGKKIADLKREYLLCRAANEVGQVTKRLEAISGKYEYQSVDITSASAIDRAVETAYRKYGRVDLVLHGAGIQVSCALTKKSLSNFRKIIATKLGGLAHLYKASKKYGAGRRTHFHILTSVFSYMGNDGQPDYGAANEAMNRIAACMDSPQSGAHWSSMAWLGWAGIGMTRDSEFAALAAARRLRGVTKEEGQQIFAAMMGGPPTTPINVLLADGEIDYYKVAVQQSSAALPTQPPAANNKRKSHVMEREISIASAPYLLNHLVDGVPTLPGAFVIALFGEAAQELRPDLKIISFEKASFHRFIKVYESRKTRVRVAARIVSEDPEQTLVSIRILSDFIHSSGLVLQKDVLQHEILVRMSPDALPVPRRLELNGFDGRRSPDPYMMNGSPVCLSGPFNAMNNIIIGGEHRRADFKINGFKESITAEQSVLSKVVLMDALWRFGVIQIGPDNSLPVFVPEACDVMKIYFDFANFDISKLVGTVTFTGANPRPEGERLHMGPVAAIDAGGNTLLVVERGVCRRFGEVRNGHAV